MTIASYTSLQAAVGTWLARSDLTAQIPTFIQLAEVKVARELRLTEMLTKDASFSITGEYVALPTGLMEVKEFHLNNSDKWQLSYMPPEEQVARYQPPTGTPRYYAIVGSNFQFAPIPDSTYAGTLVYYKKLEALASATAGSTVNTVLTTWPDLYLYGALTEAAPFLGDDPRIQTWGSMFVNAMASLTRMERKRQWSGTGLTMRAG